MDPITSQGSNYRVVWDGTYFNKVAQMVCGSNNSNCNWSNITPVSINIAQLQWSELNFWSQSLGGQVRVPLDGPTFVTHCTFTSGSPGQPGYTDCSGNPPTDATKVIFFKEDIVYPGDTIPSSLVCYDNCLQAGANGIDPTASTYTSWDPNTGQSIEHTYTFNAGTMLLTDSTGSYSVVHHPQTPCSGGICRRLVDPYPNLNTACM
jgi:hypothetical protein